MITFVILGGTGDLTKRKLLPAIYGLIEEKKISKFSVILCARHKVNVKDILRKSSKYVKNKNTKKWQKLKNNTLYHQLDFYKDDDYISLLSKLKFIEKSKSTRIFYLATLPQHFDTISENLDKYKLAPKSSKVVYEKPFGSDLKSAKKLNKCINRIFSEKQIYRIDHYLGKELVSNISLMRFTNRILEPLWCGNHVESVDIVLSEKIGIDGRGNYYDKYGALKDVVQNHCLQLLALTAMEAPKLLVGEYVRDQKALVLANTKVKKAEFGQYRGYTKEINKKSKTETYVKLQLSVNTPRWKGVKFNIMAGKCLAKRETSITLNFKHAKCLMASCPVDPNYFKIRVQPESGFELGLHSKIPGERNLLAPVRMNFCENSEFGPNTPDAYQTLLWDVIKGDQSVFVRNDEIEHAWKVIDKIKRSKLKIYSKGWSG